MSGIRALFHQTPSPRRPSPNTAQPIFVPGQGLLFGVLILICAGVFYQNLLLEELLEFQYIPRHRPRRLEIISTVLPPFVTIALAVMISIVSDRFGKVGTMVLLVVYTAGHISLNMASVFNRDIELYLDLMILDLLMWLGPSPGETVMSWLNVPFSLVRDILNRPSFIMSALDTYATVTPRHQGFVIGFYMRQLWADIESFGFRRVGSRLAVCTVIAIVLGSI